MNYHRFVRLATVLTASLLAGCNDNSEVTVYRIPKETRPEATPQQVARPGETGPALHWKAPSGWEEQPASGFRKGSFIIRGSDGQQADVSVISFPEAAGGLLANVNRWREQLKLGPISEIEQAGTRLPIGENQIFFVDIVSEQPILEGELKSRILGAILERPGETWFFKMSGEDKLVESQRDGFRQFLETLHPAHAGAETVANTSTPTAQPEPVVHYELPAGWQEQPLTSMRVASFKIAGDGGRQADVSVVFLAGTAGGDLANVNRWRGQLNLGPIDETALSRSAEHVKANGHDFTVIDLVSEAPLGERKEKIRVIAAILNEKDRSWFIKMTGEDALVASQKNAFTSFLGTLSPL